MSDTFYTMIFIFLLLVVNFGLYKYWKSLKGVEGPFYSLFNSNGDLIVLEKNKGKIPAHLKDEEISFVKSIFNVDDMYKKQAEIQGFSTTESYLAHLKGLSEDEYIYETTNLTKDAYYAQKNNMTEDEYAAVQSGVPIEEYRVKQYFEKHTKTSFNQEDDDFGTKDNSEKVNSCRNCGKEVKKGSNFCTSCGKSIEVEKELI